MTPRYTGVEMGAIWSNEHKYRTWLRIEIPACEAMHKLGMILDGLPDNHLVNNVVPAD